MPTQDNDLRNQNPQHMPLYLIELHGPRGVDVIRRHPGVPAIAAYAQTLPAKVDGFKEALAELRRLHGVNEKLARESAAHTGDLYVTTFTWRSRAQIDLSGFGAENIAITETRAADVALANASNLIAMFEGRESEAPYIAQARAELEAKLSVTKASFDALRDGRVLVQAKQREVHALAADVHAQLIGLRKAARMVLGPSHADTKMLRVERSRAVAEPPLETDPVTAPASTETAPTPASDRDSSA
jgi:hypothetical protein